MKFTSIPISIQIPISSITNKSFYNSSLYFKSQFYSFHSSSFSSLNFFNNYNKMTNNNNKNVVCLSTSSSSTTSESAKSDDVTNSLPLVQPKPKPWLIVGLGNPGKIFTGTRHNVGFEMVDAIAEAEGISMNSVSFKALFGKGYIGKVPIILSKPQTFMNLSGESVGPMVSYYKIPLQQVLLIFDDLDLPFAKLRLLPKGGHGGQNGMRSVIDHFKGDRNFPRLRIGIGRPPGKLDPATYVLRPFTKQERHELDLTMEKGVEAVRILLLEGFNKSATFVNSSNSLKQLS